MTDKTLGRRRLITTAATGLVGVAGLLGSEVSAAPPPKSKLKQLAPGTPSTATVNKIVQKLKLSLDQSTVINATQANKVVAKVKKALPNLGALASGHLSIMVTHHGGSTTNAAECSGGHLCEGHDSTPGDGPDCQTEACDTEICTGGHTCEDQSCGTEACDDGHECTGEYKGFLDLGILSASSRAAWQQLQLEVDKLEQSKTLKVEVSVP